MKLDVETIKTMVRPVITLAFVGMLVGALFTGRIGEIPDWLRAVAVGSVVWWYADRSIQNVATTVVSAINTATDNGPFAQPTVAGETLQEPARRMVYSEVPIKPPEQRG
jgi:hypothetical protein